MIARTTGTDPAVIAAWASAGVALLAAALTTAATLYAARQARRLEHQQGFMNRSAVFDHGRDTRSVTLIQAAETIQLRCWELERLSAVALSDAAMATDRLAEVATQLSGDAESLRTGWAGLRADLSDAQAARLYSRCLGCLDALDTTMWSMSLTQSRPQQHMHQVVESLSQAAAALVTDVSALRMAWRRDLG